MSGFEIAGIVLGGFPILIEAAKPLGRYFQGAERWWHFKRSFMTLISTLEDESIAYSQNLELLLTPVDLDPEVKANLQEDPKSDLWHDPGVQAKLKSRIKNQYMSWFQRQLLEMRETLDELRGMLPINQDGKVDFPKVTTVDYELLRLKQSFSSRRQHLLDNIVRINESLHKFLVRDSHINIEVARSESSWNSTRLKSTGYPGVRTLLRLQSEAKKLSCALKCGWNCHCLHQCGVRLDLKPAGARSSKGSSLRLLLGTGAVMKQTKVQVMREEDLESDYAASSSKITMLDQMADLRIQARQELAPTVPEKSVRRLGISSSVITATSTLVSPVVSGDLKLWRRREQNKLTKIEKSQAAQLSTQNTSGHRNPIVRGGLTTSTKKSVWFSDTSSSAPTSSGSSRTWVLDTCSFLESTPTWTDQLYLKVGKEAIAFSLEAKDQSGLENSEIKDLEVFYRSTPRLPDRLQIGLEIALTILGLGTSCWIPRAWDRREVFVLKTPYTSTKPFIQHQSLSFSLKETVDDVRAHTEDTLFSLGVILLELISQETLEQQSCWDTFCENGEPNDWTHQCTAMEWQSQIEARYGNDLSEPVRLCVQGGFSGDANLDNSGFLQEVIDTVVNPLERFLDGWRT